MTNETIQKLSLSVRDIVTDPGMEHMFMDSAVRRYRIACCMDTVEDAQLAVEAYRRLESSSEGADKGKLYLVVYGVLQAIFIQQDALRNLACALDFPYEIGSYSGLKEVREVRNQIVGHPTSYRREGRESFYAINRMSLSLDSFKVLESTDQGQNQMLPIDIRKTLSDNEALVRKALTDLKGKLENDIRQQKAKFRGSPLSELFSNSIGYQFEKIRGGISNSSVSDRNLASAEVEAIDNLLNDFHKALSQRGRPPEEYPGVDLVWDELQYPLREIRAFFSDKDEEIQRPDPEATRIFVWFVQWKLDELLQLSREIDEYYNCEDTG